MPNFNQALNNIRESVERPVIYDITRQLMNIVGISEDTTIYFFGEEGKAPQQNSTITKDDSRLNRWAYDKSITIEIDENFNQDRLYSTIVNNPGNNCIFRDPNLPVLIKPIYGNTEIKITVKYKAIDKNSANRWYNEMRVRATLGSNINLHTISYHYQIPDSFVYILQEIHRLMENQAGYGKSFDEYFTDYLTNNASVVTNLAGTNGVFAVSEKQNRIQGIYEWTGIPDKPEKEGDQDNWAASFTYKFTYEKPISANMNYPLVIHNQLLSEKYRPKNDQKLLENIATTQSLLTQSFSPFETDQFSVRAMSSQGLSYPTFDDFKPNSVPPSSIRVITALVQVVPENLTAIMNLNDFNEHNLDLDILKFLKESEYPFIANTFKSIFCLTMYKESFVQKYDTLNVDSNLEITSAAPLDLRKTYRLRLSLITNIDLLTREAISRIKRYPVARDKIIAAINSSLTMNVGSSDLPKNSLSFDDMITLGVSPDIAYKYFHREKPPFGYIDGNHIGFNTTQTLFVSVEKTLASQ